MNTRRHIFSLALISLFIASCGNEKSPLAPPETPKGVDVGNGGDSYSGEFVEIAYELLAVLRASSRSGVTAKELRQGIQATKVISVKALELNGKPIDAVNYPVATPPRIEINREAWDRLNDKHRDKVQLVFHEYLGILGRDDSNYQISRQVDQANVCERSGAVRRFLENHFEKTCYDVNDYDLQSLSGMDISGKKIKDLKPGDFEGLRNMEYLSLKQNFLTTVPSHAVFAPLISLRTLDLSWNHIKSIELDTFKNLKRINRVQLDENTSELTPFGSEICGRLSLELEVPFNNSSGVSRGFICKKVISVE